MLVPAVSLALIVGMIGPVAIIVIAETTGFAPLTIIIALAVPIIVFGAVLLWITGAAQLWQRWRRRPGPIEDCVV